MYRLSGVLAFLLACGVLNGGPGPSLARAGPTTEFPLPEGLRPAVAFWKRVYLEVTTDAGLLHDSTHLGVVYEVVRFRPGTDRRSRERHLDSRRARWRRLLERAAAGGKPSDSHEESVLAQLETALGRTPTARDLRLAARRIRFQLGQRDKFRDGLIRSGASEDAMAAAFRAQGLPEDLAYLPHVESSFNPRAYSKYGAAGLWQFMRSTGRRFLRIDYVVDERLDPMVSTRAAARLLKENYDSLGTWPLAITAYNHGRSGVKRAVRAVGSKDIGEIVRRYRSRRFGFASRNFYAQFLAARDIVRAYESYFGPLDREEPEPADEIELPFYVDTETLHLHVGVPPEVVREYNPALRPPVFRSGRRIPTGYTLRLPAATVYPTPDEWLARIPGERRHAKQLRPRYYQVRRGDTLARIAKRHGTTIGALVAMNNLPSRHRIYAGQVLDLPGTEPAPSSGSIVRKAHARPAPKPPAKIDPVEGPPPPLPTDSPWRRIDGDTIRVDASETLGHFADWLEVPAQRLRDLNRIRSGRSLRMGQRLRLDFSRVDPETLLRRRIEYHKGIEEDFFGSYRVAGTVSHTLRGGESPWILARRTYGVPIWLIHRYNPDVDLQAVKPGETLKIPVVERLGKS